ncbi:MAG: hypothetical protein IJ761_02650 [Bacteroidales bacterium]|nr:hypothetical protein [Bacteroidales bacterium]
MEDNVTREEFSRMIATGSHRLREVLNSRIELMTDNVIQDVAARLDLKAKTDSSNVEICLKMLDDACHSAVPLGALLSLIQISLVLHDMKYPMDDSNRTPALVLEHAKIQTVLCPVHYLLHDCVERVKGRFDQNGFTPGRTHGLMQRRTTNSLLNSFGELPFIRDVALSCESFIQDTRIAVADTSWLLSTVYDYIDIAR